MDEVIVRSPPSALAPAEIAQTKTTDRPSVDLEAAARLSETTSKGRRARARTQSTQETDITQQTDPTDGDDVSSSCYASEEDTRSGDEEAESKRQTSLFSRIAVPASCFLNFSDVSEKQSETCTILQKLSIDESECDSLVEHIRKPSSFGTKREHHPDEEITLPQPQRRQPPSCLASSVQRPSPSIFTPSLGGAFTRYCPAEDGARQSISKSDCRARQVKWNPLEIGKDDEDDKEAVEGTAENNDADNGADESDLSSLETGGSLLKPLPDMSAIAAASTAWHQHTPSSKKAGSVLTGTETSGSLAEDDVSLLSSRPSSSLTDNLSVNESSRSVWLCRCNATRCLQNLVPLWILQAKPYMQIIIIIMVISFLAAVILTVVVVLSGGTTQKDETEPEINEFDETAIEWGKGSGGGTRH